MVRLRSPAPTKAHQTRSLIYGGFPERPKGADCKSVVTDFGGPNPPSPTNKKRTFVYQKFSFCLSKPQAWYIIAARSAVHIISPFGVAYHHAPACISLRLDEIQHFVLMICNSFGIDDIQGYALILSCNTKPTHSNELFPKLQTWHIISPFGAASHHAPACIYLRRDKSPSRLGEPAWAFAYRF